MPCSKFLRLKKMSKVYIISMAIIILTLIIAVILIILHFFARIDLSDGHHLQPLFTRSFAQKTLYTQAT